MKTLTYKRSRTADYSLMFGNTSEKRLRKQVRWSSPYGTYLILVDRTSGTRVSYLSAWARPLLPLLAKGMTLPDLQASVENDTSLALGKAEVAGLVRALEAADYLEGPSARRAVSRRFGAKMLKSAKRFVPELALSSILSCWAALLVAIFIGSSWIWGAEADASFRSLIDLFEPLAIFFTLAVWFLLHELGHILMALSLGISVHGFVIGPALGGRIRGVRLGVDVADALVWPNRWHRFSVFVAGPLVDLSVLVLLVAMLRIWPEEAPWIVTGIWSVVIALLGNIAPIRSTDLSKALSNLVDDPLMHGNIYLRTVRRTHVASFLCIIMGIVVWQSVAFFN